ncbi:MAG: GNAT family N-acetyltransferase [Syntrophomonadaceae bacterium]|nr:GNAT family N-acetyltransferase [Syntrophomonadaceae bacterium]MDD3022325.1 GNAT family N-acetyltransferase [Syntrophomonadaceae bacterium]
MGNIVLETGAAELLLRVKPLWEELNAYHASISPAFSQRYANMNFTLRQQDLLEKSYEGALWVGLARIVDGPDIGYCIGSIDRQQQAEVDSLFVKSEYRKRGVGEALVREVLAWMDEHSTEARIIRVGAGNEQAVPFYARYGFAPRMLVLQHVE